MKQLVEFTLEDGSSIYIETNQIEGSIPIAKTKRGPHTPVEQAETRFANAISKIRPAAETVLQAFRELNTPEEICLEFGIKFAAQTGAIIASVDSEATFKVSIKWTNKN